MNKEMLNAQITELYEQSDMEPIQIAEALGLEEESVKMVLISSSSKFRKDSKKNPSLFTDDEFAMAKARMSSLVWSEKDNVSYKAAKFILYENLGRNNTQSLKMLNINVNLINDQMLAAKKAIEQGKNKIIDIPTEVKHLSE
ncbi:MAG TPA: hypothetical protein VF849_00055 [Blattabacteriaceae bacterium]